MCLVLLAYGVHPDTPVLLAGNRDERYDRPSSPPALRSRNPPIWAGLDEQDHGTWMGLNSHGLTAVLTNYYRAGTFPPGSSEPGLQSRGQIVMALLAHATPQQAAHWAAGLNPSQYRPFSLLFGSPQGFYYHSSERPGPPEPLAPGYYALSNAGLNDRSWPKVEKSLNFWQRCGSLPGERLIEQIQWFLRDSAPPDPLWEDIPGRELHGPMGAVFIRTPRFGTRSSAVITVGGGLGTRYLFADENDLYRTLETPHENPFHPVNLTLPS